MQSEITPEALTDWLDLVTLELPNAVSVIVRAELEAHYADTVRELQASGKTADQAQRAALAQLGDAGETLWAFRVVYSEQGGANRAAWVALIFPVAFIIGFMFPWPVGDLIIYPALVIPTIYLLYAFHKLLVKHYDFRALRYPAMLTAMGFIGIGLPPLLATLTLREWASALPYALDKTSAGNPLAMGAAGIFLVGLVAASAGLLWLGVRLSIGFPGKLRPAARLLVYTFNAGLVLTGVGLVGYTLLVVVRAWGIATLMLVMVGLALCLVHGLWALVFQQIMRHAPQRTLLPKQ